MLNKDCLCSTCQVCQMTKKERKKCGLIPPKTAESDIISLVHGLCGSGGSIYNKDTSLNTFSSPLLESIMWVMAFREIENLMSMKEPAEKTRMLQTLLKGQDLSYFEYH
jgi:hypothetical protein